MIDLTLSLLPAYPPPLLLHNLSVPISNFTPYRLPPQHLLSRPTSLLLVPCVLLLYPSDLDVRSLFSEDHADGVDVLRLAHERSGDVVHLVHQPELLEVVDVLQRKRKSSKRNENSRRWWVGGWVGGASIQQDRFREIPSTLYTNISSHQRLISKSWSSTQTCKCVCSLEIRMDGSSSRKKKPAGNHKRLR